MRQAPLFIGLTREVTFAGLPLMYLILLKMISMIGFIVTGSFIYLILSAVTGYVALRGLAAYDPKIIGVYLIALQKTRMSQEFLMGRGQVYRA